MEENDKRCPACGAALEYLRPALLPDRLNFLSARADLYVCPACGRYEFYRDPRWLERDREREDKTPPARD